MSSIIQLQFSTYIVVIRYDRDYMRIHSKWKITLNHAMPYRNVYHIYRRNNILYYRDAHANP